MFTERQFIKKVADAAQEAVLPLGKKLVEAVNAEARKQGIDGRYVQFILSRDPSSWPHLQGRQREALTAMVSLAMADYAIKSSDFTMPPVEKEDAVNKVIEAAAKWSWEFRPILRRAYLMSLKPFVGTAKTHLNATTDRSWPDRDAALWIHATLKDAVEHEPLGIDRALLLYQITDLIG